MITTTVGSWQRFDFQMRNEVEQIVGRAELVYVGLVDAMFHRASTLSFDVTEEEKYISQTLLSDPVFDDEGTTASALVKCRIWAAPSKEAETVSHDEFFESSGLQIEAVYVVGFEISNFDVSSEAALRRFFATIGLMTVWPYFRTHCAKIAADASIVLPPVPLKKAKFPMSEQDYTYMESAND